jgi:hypothetical protein
MSEVFVSRGRHNGVRWPGAPDRLANKTSKCACNCCTAALHCCGAGSRPYMPSLGVSSLDSRPPQGGLLFGDDRPGSLNRDARSTAVHLPLLPLQIVGVPL